MLQTLSTWQLVPGQPEGVTDDLFVHQATDLKNDLVDGHSGGPVVEGALALAHTHLFIESISTPAKSTARGLGELSHLIATDEHADVASHTLVQPELLPAQPLLDGVLGHFEMVRTDAPMMVAHAQTVVPPNHGGPLGRSSCWNPWPALSHLPRARNIWFQPITSANCRR